MTKSLEDVESSVPCYEVRVWDNFHYMNEDEAYTLSGFNTAEDALAKCKAIVDGHLEDCAKQHDTIDAIYQCYTMFGEDPVMIARNGAPNVEFSGWNYAKVQAQHFVEKGIDT